MTKDERTQIIFLLNRIAKEYWQKGIDHAKSGSNVAPAGDPLLGLTNTMLREVDDTFFKERIQELRKITGLGILDIRKVINEMPDASIEEQINYFKKWKVSNIK